MNLKWMKSVTRVFKKSKNQIIKHAPQIMAVAGASCFVAATYCAVKETPKAMEKLEEKKALDPDMSTLQKVAVVAPEYKKTICFTLAGVGFTAGAWKIEATRMAEMVGIASTAIDKNRKLEEAARAVVGDEKAEEIVKKADDDICPFDEDPDTIVPDEYKIVPCRIAMTGKTYWSSRKKMIDAMTTCQEELKENGFIGIEDVYGNLGAGQCDMDLCWAVSKSDGFGYDDFACKNELGYQIVCWEDEYHRLGWELRFSKYPYKL